ncbi:hypothetical protein EYZ11_007654 [Aspergillus tanneri]|uniref:Uncharacterized protein n=1 Tax=Aspergillus tanneri TaxID=1220188 RepID=A0A4S3JCG8_9EURO|nr:hypothetical protein EYZ11_007654 [Aspergillus tanneri]
MEKRKSLSSDMPIGQEPVSKKTRQQSVFEMPITEEKWIDVIKEHAVQDTLIIRLL